VDLFVRHLPQRLQVAVYVFACLVGIVYFSAFAYQTAIDGLKAFADKETVMANFIFYVWPSRWVLPLGFATIALALVVNAINAVRQGEAFSPATETDSMA
jgi:TRAP-type C4-dicarboxylate transport system permease small subunit